MCTLSEMHVVHTTVFMLSGCVNILIIFRLIESSTFEIVSSIGANLLRANLKTGYLLTSFASINLSRMSNYRRWR